MRNHSMTTVGFAPIAGALAILAMSTVVLAGGPPPPPVPGVCCRPGNVCQNTTNVFDDCYQNGFDWIIGVTCASNPCAPPSTGACCFGVECASNFTAENCANNEGVFQGVGSTCAGNPCSPPQACCFSNGTCQMQTPSQCGGAGGVTLDFQDCANAPCGVGACCTTVSCIEANAYDCLLNGYNHQGPGTTCTPSPCVTTGACCFPDSTCQVITLNDCNESGGTPQGLGVSCENADCGAAACCFEEGGCELLSATACASLGGILLGTPECTPNPCSVGACCTTTNCVNTSAYTCIFNGYNYQGAGVACTPSLCLQPCICVGDVNLDFTFNALDIQAFVNCVINFNLTCSCADINIDGVVNQGDVGPFINIIMNTTGDCL